MRFSILPKRWSRSARTRFDSFGPLIHSIDPPGSGLQQRAVPLQTGIHAVDSTAQIREFSMHLGADFGKSGWHVVGEASDQFGNLFEVLWRHLYIPMIVVSENRGNLSFTC
jgi:hypothetical protein